MEVRRRVDAIWDRIWASGVSNPLTAIEYVSTVLLLRRLDETGDTTEAGGSLRRELLGLIEEGDAPGVAALMLQVQTGFGIGASPDVASSSTWHDLTTLRDVLREVRDLELTDRNHDMLGDLFEYVLDHLSTAGHFGQFRTPRHLIKFLVEVVDPRPGEVVVDPAVGTAGFLVAAHEFRGGGPDERYLGNEVDATIARVARTNMLLHGLRGDVIDHGDSLQIKDRDADVILANPPFAGTVIPDRVADFESGTLKTELLFVELMMRRLRPGGRAGVVVPVGVLTSSSGPAVWIRRRLVESQRLHAVVELPGGVFRPYTGVKTALLIWSNEPPARTVLLVRVDADGYSLDDRRSPVPADDLPGALRLLRGERSDVPHATVEVEDLAGHQFNLSPSRYITHAGVGSGVLDALPLPSAVTAVRRAAAAVLDELDHVEGLL
jgi:type I restriction enzyme M protein